MSFDRSGLPTVRFHSVGDSPSDDFVFGPFLYSLNFSRGDEKNNAKEFGLEKDVIRISGHDNEEETTATVYLDRRIVSRNHASLSWKLKEGNTKPKLYLTDLDSTHGSFIHRAKGIAAFQARSGEDEEIKDGDCITIGRKIEKSDECHFPAMFEVSFEYGENPAIVKDSQKSLKSPTKILPFKKAVKQTESKVLSPMFNPSGFSIEDEGLPSLSVENEEELATSSNLPLSEEKVKAGYEKIFLSSDDEEVQEKEQDSKTAFPSSTMKTKSDKVAEFLMVTSDEEESENDDEGESSKEEESDEEDSIAGLSESEDSEEHSDSEDDSTDLTDNSKDAKVDHDDFVSNAVLAQETDKSPSELHEGTEMLIVVQESKKELLVEDQTFADELLENIFDNNEAPTDVRDEVEEEEEEFTEKGKGKALEVEEEENPLSTCETAESSTSKQNDSTSTKRSADVAGIDDVDVYIVQTADIAHKSFSKPSQSIPKRQRIGFGAGLAAGFVAGIVGTIVGLSTIPLSDNA